MFLVSLSILSFALFVFTLWQIHKLKVRIDLEEKVIVSLSGLLSDLATASKFNSEAGRELTKLVDLIQKDNMDFQNQMSEFALYVSKILECETKTFEDVSDTKKNPLN